MHAAVPWLVSSTPLVLSVRVIKAEIAGGTEPTSEGKEEAWDIWISGRVWELVKADGGHEHRWRLGLTISAKSVTQWRGVC